MHLGEPVEEAEKLAAFGEEEVEEVAGADGFGVEAGVGFETPAEVGAAPGAETMAASGGPEEADGFEHMGLRLILPTHNCTLVLGWAWIRSRAAGMGADRGVRDGPGRCVCGC